LSVRVDALTAADWDAVRRIHADGIATGIATFETEPPSCWEEWSAGHLEAGRLAARDAGGAVLGWAALGAVSSRCCYGGVGEVSVYVAEAARGAGVGRALLERLVAESERAGLWTLQAGIFAENAVSVRLHERCGFRLVGRRERLGRLRGRWHDVLLLERRSPVVGVD
jgi:phosphinothricin acetyltransferase